MVNDSRNTQQSEPSAAGSGNFQSQRLLSLDALRGFDMFWIIGGASFVSALITLSGIDSLQGVKDQFSHVKWNGFRFWDLIFPLFLFMSGATMPFSLVRRLEQGTPRAALALRAIRRGLLLVLLGFIYNGMLEFDWANLRYPSVLGHIGLAYLFAALIVLYFGLRGQVAWFCGLLLVYWAAMKLIPVPGHGAGVLTLEGNLAAWIDRTVLPGRLHQGIADPEGLLSTVPAISTALMGCFAGTFLRRQHPGGHRKFLLLVAAGFVSLAVGLLWNRFFPINKHLWSSSFVMYAGGWSLLLLAVFYVVIDVWGLRRWTFPFVLIGLNSITIYMAAHQLIDFEHTSEFLFGGVVSHSAESLQSLLRYTGILLVEMFFLYVLYRKKIFLRV